MSRKTTDEQLNKIAAELVGSCERTIQEVCESEGFPAHDDWTKEDYEAFDQLAFCCAICGWWCSGDDHGSEEAEDEAGNFVCSECGPEDD